MKQRMMQIVYIVLMRLLVAYCLFLSGNAHAVKNTQAGMLDFNLYPYLSDVENDSVFTLNIAAKLAGGFSYFSLTNLYNQHNADSLSETNSYYTEQNIRWRIHQTAFDLTGQFNFRTGNDNDRHRLGVRWRLNDTDALSGLFEKLNLTWSVNFHLLQVDHTQEDEWQMEHVFRMTFPSLSDRIYLSGFVDQTFGERLAVNMPAHPMIGEVQVGYRMLENLYFIAEYRVNQYRRTDVNNIGVGIEYKLLW